MSSFCFLSNHTSTSVQYNGGQWELFTQASEQITRTVAVRFVISGQVSHMLCACSFSIGKQEMGTLSCYFTAQKQIGQIRTKTLCFRWAARIKRQLFFRMHGAAAEQENAWLHCRCAQENIAPESNIETSFASTSGRMAISLWTAAQERKSRNNLTVNQTSSRQAFFWLDSDGWP